MGKKLSENAELIEALAAVEHERWSHWQSYMHQKCERNADDSLTIPPELVARWERQMRTDYLQLHPAEKQSDREQVLAYLAVIDAASEG